MRKTLSVLLVSSFLFGTAASLSGCSLFEKDKDGSKTTETEETSVTSEDEGELEVLSLVDNLQNGVWFDEHGPYLKITDKLWFIRENLTYDLISVEEDGLVVNLSENGEFRQDVDTLALPIGSEMKLPCVMTSDGHIDFMGLDLFDENTKEGKKALRKVDESLSDDIFSCTFDQTYFEASVKDGVLSYINKYSDDIKNTDITVWGDHGVLDSDDIWTEGPYYIYYEDVDDDNVFFVVDGVILCNNDMDYNDILGMIFNDGAYLIDGSGEVPDTLRIEDDKLIVTDTETGTDKEYSFVYNSSVDSYSNDKMIIMGEGFDLYCTTNMYGGGYSIYLPWNYNKLLMDISDKIRIGKTPNTVMSNEFDHSGKKGDISAVVDLRGKDVSDVWIWDYATISFKDSDVNSIFDLGDEMASDIIEVGAGEKFSYVDITFKISKRIEEDEIYILNSRLDEDYNIITDKIEFESEVDGDMRILSFRAVNEGYYCVYSEENFYANRETISLLTSDPSETDWALNNYTGDILNMVDTHYIADSIIDEYGSACFWVSTPEQLASVFYYVSAHEIKQNEYSNTVYYVHLLNDIDLEGYDFVPLGDPYDHEIDGQNARGYFKGVFFGNGHSIKNYTCTNSDYNTFFLYSVDMTVIGLTLDHPNIADTFGNRHAFFFGGCRMQFYDCSYIVDPGDEDLYVFGEEDNDSRGVFDCTAYIGRNGDTKETGLNREYADYYYNGSDNWIRMYYQDRNGEYSYDPQEEYSDFQNDSSVFYDMSYYYGEGEEYDSGPIDGKGWLVDGKFYSDYGFIFDI